MRKLILCMSISVDGVVAPENYEGITHDDEDVWKHHFRMLESVDTILLGAGMHAEYLKHWHEGLTKPESRNEGKFAEIAARTPHLVLSRTLKKVEWPNASVLSEGVSGIAALKKQSGGDIVLWGGASVTNESHSPQSW